MVTFELRLKILSFAQVLVHVDLCFFVKSICHEKSKTIEPMRKSQLPIQRDGRRSIVLGDFTKEKSEAIGSKDLKEICPVRGATI